MCEVCAIFGAGEHWSDFARLRDEKFPFADIMHYRSERARRIGILNDVLASRGLHCEEWDGETLAVYDLHGRFKLAPTLNDVWGAADAMDGQSASDPLQPGFSHRPATAHML